MAGSEREWGGRPIITSSITDPSLNPPASLNTQPISPTMHAMEKLPAGGAVVVFAKCPTPGASKTRLASLLGDDGAASLAQAMLMDILEKLSECEELKCTCKVLMYAPRTQAAESQMISILNLLHLPCVTSDTDSCDTTRWHLLPMISNSAQQSTENKSDLTSSSLGDKLIDALDRTRILLAKNKNACQCNESVLFLGMDSPEIPIEEVICGLQTSSGKFIDATRQSKHRGKAHLCPANDGGYGLLSVPIHAPSTIFSGVRWSNHLTAVSQLKALTDTGVDVTIGQLMFDIDEPDDVRQLATRLKEKNKSVPCQSNDDVLTKFTSEIGKYYGASMMSDKECPYTSQTLANLGML